ncbi:AraC family transcriptional regulator [Paenibacillus macerans]|uniref:helix-turn-helix domain-containing protein n=1 Tax=Paenibacillus macerans TaxID=44252 RepID=UPI003D30FE07
MHVLRDILYDNDERTFSVSHRKALSIHMPSSHFHSTYEIYYLLAGKRDFFIKDRTIVIEAGDIVIIPPNMLHRTTNAKIPEHERLIVNIHEKEMIPAKNSSPDILQPLFEKEYILIRSSQLDQVSIQSLAQQIILEMREAKPGFEMYALTLTLQLLIICCRHVKQSSPEPPVFPSPMHERISEIVRYINDHYSEKLSLHLLAEKFYVSPYYVSRCFKEATGFTFVEYLNSIRVKEAKKLLVHSSLKVNLIAKKVGFGSVTHFGRVFKQVTGHAPLFYKMDK